MGGKAFLAHGIKTQRLSKSMYLALTQKLEEMLTQHFQARVKAPLFCKGKKDFGDIDLVVATEGWLAEKTMGELAEEFKKLAKDFKSRVCLLQGVDILSHEGPLKKEQELNIFSTVSIEFRFEEEESEGVEIDLLLCPPQSFNNMLAFYSHNDASNIVGVMANKLGFSWGFQGLRWTLENSGGNPEELMVTKNPEEVLSFLGYEPEQWRQPFENFEAMFKYVSSSPYFHKSFFEKEGQTNREKLKISNRKTLREFSKWVDSNPVKNSLFFQESMNKDEHSAALKEYGLAKAKLMFPEFGKKLHTLRAKVEKENWLKQNLRPVYNSYLLGSWTGLKGKDLGVFKKSFESAFPVEILSEAVKGRMPKLLEYLAKHHFDSMRLDDIFGKNEEVFEQRTSYFTKSTSKV